MNGPNFYSVLGSGLGRLITYIETNAAVNGNPMQYLHDTPCKAVRYFDGSANLSGWTAGTLFWAFVANSVGIIGASLPTLGPLWNSKGRNRQTLPTDKYVNSSQKYKHGEEFDTSLWTDNENEAYDQLDSPQVLLPVRTPQEMTPSKDLPVVN